jgi:hypothetical protein
MLGVAEVEDDAYLATGESSSLLARLLNQPCSSIIAAHPFLRWITGRACAQRQRLFRGFLFLRLAISRTTASSSGR